MPGETGNKPANLPFFQTTKSERAEKRVNAEHATWSQVNEK
jgi:hypothetical protein